MAHDIHKSLERLAGLVEGPGDSQPGASSPPSTPKWTPEKARTRLVTHFIEILEDGETNLGSLFGGGNESDAAQIAECLEALHKTAAAKRLRAWLAHPTR